MTRSPTPYSQAMAELLMAERAQEDLAHRLNHLGPHETLEGLARRLTEHHRELAERLGHDPEVIAFIRGALFGALAQQAADRLPPLPDPIHPPSHRE